ncbi:MAG: CZB domain-containing protein [Hydrogenophaga sp.]|nr:CZB domain-containing protein [Hydrogenophaga sp.]
MRVKNLRFVNWPVWRPAAALMRRLRFPGKMALISLAFALPVAWMLYHFLVDEMQGLHVAAQERHGVSYARGVYRLQSAADQWRYAARSQALGRRAEPVEDARKRFDEALVQLRQLHQQHGAEWKLSDDWQRLDEQIGRAQALQGGSPADIYATLVPLSRSIGALLSDVTDQSGLALDPDLTTYYLMSATLFRGPEVVRQTAEMRGLAHDILRAGQMDPAQTVRLTAMRTLLGSELERAREDLSKVADSDPEAARQLVQDAPKATAAYLAEIDRLFPVGTSAVQGDPQALVDLANQTLATQYRQVDANLGLLDELLVRREGNLLQALWINLAITAAGLGLAMFLAMGFYRSMFGGFKVLRRHLMAISMGDLRAEIDAKGTDEISDLLREVGYTQHALRQTVQQVQSASDSVVQASLEIAEGTRDLSSRTEAAAAALEESSAALEQTTSSVAHTAASAEKAAEIAIDNARVAEQGGAVMGEVVNTMERIQSSSRRINEIIGVIDGIAFQTNILALNAAVEAARAGEQGRGFAVVAGEVRSLAQRSSTAAKEIRELIVSSVSDVDGGMKVVKDAGDAMHEIVRHATQVRTLLDEVANGTREQSMGISQIGQAVQDLDRNTQSNAALVEETAAASTSQRTAAVRMAAQVDEFRLPGAVSAHSKVEGIDVDVMIDAHRQWKVKLRDAIESRERVDTATLSRDDCCALGKWIYGEGSQRLGGRHSFNELIERHKRFHSVAGGVGELINRRAYREAEDALAPGTSFATATSDVVMVLSSAKRLGF